jgi:hypothetical protein
MVSAAALLAAAFLFLVLPLPPRPLSLPAERLLTASGSFHVHSSRSDGSGSPDEIAEAAARAGLTFVVLTDHGDGTRQPDSPRYRSGVLVIDGVELSTQGGHYIAVGMPPAPYPLRGEARDVIEDVKRLGGFGVVAHPDSAKPELRWNAWDAPFDALEWLNADSEWRDESRWQFARALARYPFRPAETLASLLDRPNATLERWDALTKTRRVVALAGADAHARAGWSDDEPNGYRWGWFLRIPSYRASFSAFTVRVPLAQPLQQTDAAADARTILSALRAGEVYTAIDGLAAPASLEFRQNGPAMIARTNAPADAALVLRRDGAVVAQGPAPELMFESRGEPGTYRVEVRLANAPGDPTVPWIVSNPIYIRPEGWGTPPPATRLHPEISMSIQGGPWRSETDSTSSARVSQPVPLTGPVDFTYRLGEGNRAGQYAALTIPVGNALTDRTQLALRANARRPMRVSVQARQPQSGSRWQRSVYLDQEVRDVVVRFDDMTPVGTSGVFDPSRADTVMFVVDLTNATPGTAGAFTIHDLRIER